MQTPSAAARTQIEECTKSRFSARYRTPSAPHQTSVNTDFRSGGVLSAVLSGCCRWVTLSPSLTDCPLPPLLSSRPRLRALSSAHQVALVTFSSEV